jgi:RHS repeat-associated protein
MESKNTQKYPISLLIGLFTVIFGITSALAEEQLYFYHNDHLGTPQVMTDEDQNVVWEAEYRPFGEVVIVTEAVENNLRYPGQYFDRESGLHYNYFRDYDPSIGRYSTSDPIGLLGGINTYGYVLQNPIRYTDQNGLNPGTGCIAGAWAGPAGCGIGAAVGTAIMGGAVLAAMFSTPGDTSSDSNSDAQSCPIPPDDENQRCKSLRRRAANLRREIYEKRIPGLDANQNILPIRVSPNESLSESVRGHITLLNTKFSQLRKVEKQI